MNVPEQAILRWEDVIRTVRLSRETICRRMKDGDFPKPVRLGGPGSRALGWRRTDIERWLNDLSSN